MNRYRCKCDKVLYELPGHWGGGDDQDVYNVGTSDRNDGCLRLRCNACALKAEKLGFDVTPAGEGMSWVRIGSWPKGLPKPMMLDGWEEV